MINNDFDYFDNLSDDFLKRAETEQNESAKDLAGDNLSNPAETNNAESDTNVYKVFEKNIGDLCLIQTKILSEEAQSSNEQNESEVKQENTKVVSDKQNNFQGVAKNFSSAEQKIKETLIVEMQEDGNIRLVNFDSDNSEHHDLVEKGRFVRELHGQISIEDELLEEILGRKIIDGRNGKELNQSNFTHLTKEEADSIKNNVQEYLSLIQERIPLPQSGVKQEDKTLFKETRVVKHEYTWSLSSSTEETKTQRQKIRNAEAVAHQTIKEIRILGSLPKEIQKAFIKADAKRKERAEEAIEKWMEESQIRAEAILYDISRTAQLHEDIIDYVLSKAGIDGTPNDDLKELVTGAAKEYTDKGVYNLSPPEYEKVWQYVYTTLQTRFESNDSNPVKKEWFIVTHGKSTLRQDMGPKGG